MARKEEDLYKGRIDLTRQISLYCSDEGRISYCVTCCTVYTVSEEYLKPVVTTERGQLYANVINAGGITSGCRFVFVTSTPTNRKEKKEDYFLVSGLHTVVAIAYDLEAFAVLDQDSTLADKTPEWLDDLTGALRSLLKNKPINVRIPEAPTKPEYEVPTLFPT